MVIPIFKDGNKSLVGNYRPISLVPVMGEIFEKVMYNRVSNFLTRFNILGKSQYGFQKQKSTEDAIMDLNTKIINAMEEKQHSCAVFLDFAKAFDTVNHNILINKLHHYGIRGPAFSWLQSYLSNREQCVNIGYVKSKLTQVKHGVPQGSILGPLLFLLYINDIVNSSKKLKFLLFADDTSLFFSSSSQIAMETTLNEELSNVSNWLKANKLSLNVDKSKVVNFSKHQDPEVPIRLRINNEPIELTTCVKYLGTLIDNKLSYQEHIKYISQKINKGNGILYQLRKLLPEDKLKNVYYAHIHSHINYTIGAWGGTTQTHFKRILKKQKKSLNIMYFKDKNKTTNCGILDANKIKLINWLKKLWKVTHGNIFSLEWLNSSLQRNPRDNFKFLVPFKSTTLGKNSICYNGIKIWNKLPTDIRNCPTFGLFCKKIKLQKLT